MGLNFPRNHIANGSNLPSHIWIMIPGLIIVNFLCIFQVIESNDSDKDEITPFDDSNIFNKTVTSSELNTSVVLMELDNYNVDIPVLQTSQVSVVFELWH